MGEEDKRRAAEEAGRLVTLEGTVCWKVPWGERMLGTEQVCREREKSVCGSALPGIRAGKGRAALLQALHGHIAPLYRKLEHSKFKERSEDHPAG